MGEPCRQEGKIGGLEASVDSIQGTLERFISVLEKISAQGEKIIHLEQGQDVLFNRVRQLELDASSEKTKTALIVAGITTVVAAVVSWFFKHLGGN
jgi:precorrin-4 methylase